MPSFPLSLSLFPGAVRVRAVNGDRAIGHPIVYSIASGPDDIFSISPDSGVVYTQVTLDRESPRSSNGAYILAIQGRRVSREILTCAFGDTG